MEDDMIAEYRKYFHYKKLVMRMLHQYVDKLACLIKSDAVNSLLFQQDTINAISRAIELLSNLDENTRFYTGGDISQYLYDLQKNFNENKNFLSDALERYTKTLQDEIGILDNSKIKFNLSNIKEELELATKFRLELSKQN
jgi:hypothetical protein